MSAAIVPPVKTLKNLVTPIDNLLFSHDGQVVASLDQPCKYLADAPISYAFILARLSTSVYRKNALMIAPKFGKSFLSYRFNIL